MSKNIVESTNFANFEEVVHNFGRFDDDMILPKNDFESTNFVYFEEVVHNFGRSDNDNGKSIKIIYHYIHN